MIDAVCAGMDDSIFFGSSDPDVRPQYTLTEIKAARKLCITCPVAQTCLRSSLENRDDYGVFAGSTKTDREKILKRIESGRTTLDEEVADFLTWLKEAVGV